ncbi:hypothetical protein TSTA_099430 [Talaromyces stipitatus ATCC 10500]|uniref:AB hydrolase-1 domain-containing protein n=1 Tax=Talaromyces stipitatus (strain ATCC 10500 / CBS 375.48 / QM 6759 / NRRL 1006) TaxID=441959 RepID=B8MMD7_TALSN|nr:uncharacterized protein TSTA_099430 [Talaromyces stipitatus ATCC 10500]EED13691.1 hypothetical protein TSTA_099430 [Talaromyces stipitatus ATCC 10500]
MISASVQSWSSFPERHKRQLLMATCYTNFNVKDMVPSALLLPSVGATEHITAADDAEYVRSRMLLPVLDIEQHNVIVISHSYSSIPASAAARGLSKADRIAEGKKTWVLGQIFIAAVAAKGGDGLDLVANIGGHMPPHIRVDAVPYAAQTMMLQATGKEWNTWEIETGHSPQLAAPEKLADILVQIAKMFEAL